MYNCLCPSCGGFKVNAKGDPEFDLDLEIEKLAAEFYNGKNSKRTALTMARKVAATLSLAVGQGYGKGVFDVDWDSPDRRQIEHLQQNVYHFSFAKCNEQLKAMTVALHDKEGNIIPEKEHLDICKRINSDYTGRYHPIERSTAITSSQMASQWVLYQAEKDTFPILVYRTVGDDNVRSSHRLLDGKTFHIDDKVLDIIWTPNGWGCRCDIEQSESDEVTPSEDIVIPKDIPAMFRTNLAKSGLVFPKDHPYFENVTGAVLNTADQNNPFLYQKVHSGKKGGYVFENAVHIEGKDWENELSMAKTLAQSGEKVVFLPEINPQTEWKEALREIVLPDGVKAGKNADTIINGNQVVEFKTSSANTLNSVKELLKTGAKQADTICIKLTDKMALSDIKRALKGQVKQSVNVNEVWVIDVKDKITKYSREDMLNFFKSKKQK